MHLAREPFATHATFDRRLLRIDLSVQANYDVKRTHEKMKNLPKGTYTSVMMTVSAWMSDNSEYPYPSIECMLNVSMNPVMAMAKSKISGTRSCPNFWRDRDRPGA